MRKRSVRVLLAVAALGAAGCSSVYLKGTPLYTGEYSKPQGPPEDRVNLWPLAYYHKPALSVLWPLIEFTDDHAAVRPFFSVYDLDKPKHEWNILPPLAQFECTGEDYRIFPFFWGEDYDKKPYFVAFPEVWWYDDAKGIFPVFWWKDYGKVNHWAVFPLAWHAWRDHTIVFPFWLDFTKDSDERDTHVLWPIFRLKDTKAEKGWQVWPLIGDFRGQGSPHARRHLWVIWPFVKDYRSDAHRHSYALWPLLHHFRDNDRTIRVAAPFYFESGEKDWGWWLLVPFAYRAKDGADSTLITPLWSAGREGDVRWEALAPLYYRRVDAAKESETLLTPLAARSKSPERTEWTLVPLLSSVAWGKGEKDIWLLAPLAHARWGGANVQHHVLPLYDYDRNDGRFLSLPASWRSKDGDGFLNLGTLLFHTAWQKDGKKEVVLPILLTGVWWNAGKEKDDKGIATLPLFQWRSTTRQYPGRVLPIPTPPVTTRSESLWVFPWLLAERGFTTESGAEGKPSAIRSADRSSSFFPLWDYARYRATDSGGKLTGSTRFSLLTWLYDYRLALGKRDAKDKEKTHDTIRSRFLVRLVHYEKLDGDESLDVFPFITWDRKADGYRKVSFLWRLFRHERRADGSRNLDLFFLPVLRKKGG